MTTANKYVGYGCTLNWDATGGTSFAALGDVVDGDKVDSKWKTANTSLLSEKADTFRKTSYDPGSFKFTVVYDPAASNYTDLLASFVSVNVPAANWQIQFPHVASGSGSGPAETFFGYIVGLSREV